MSVGVLMGVSVTLLIGGHSFGQAVSPCRLISASVPLSVDLLVGWCASRSVGWCVSWCVGQSVGRWAGRSVSRSVSRLVFITQSNCQRAFSLFEIQFQRTRVRVLHSTEENNLFSFKSNTVCLCQSIKFNTNPWVRSCIQQSKTSCLLSIQKSFARGSNLTATNMCIARARCEIQPAVESSGVNACWS